MQPLGLTGYRLAKELAVSARRVNDIGLGKRAITADSALQFGLFFNLPPEICIYTNDNVMYEELVAV